MPEKTLIRYATQNDLSAILKVEWKCFKGQFDVRYTPIELLVTFSRYPKAFRVIEDGNHKIIGYSCSVFLSPKGSQELLSAKVSALQDMDQFDVSKYGIEPTQHLHFEVLATLDPTDIYTGWLLIKDLIDTRLIESGAIRNLQFVTAEAITNLGHRLLRKAGFEPKGEYVRWPDGTTSRLYLLDLHTNHGKDIALKFRLLSTNEQQSVLERANEKSSETQLKSIRGLIEASPSQAIESLIEYLRSNSNDPRPWGMLGVAYDLIKDRKSALKSYQKSLELYTPLQNTVDYAWLNIASIFYLLGRIDDLTQSLKPPLNIENADPWFWFRLGYLYSRVYKFREAIQCFEKVLDRIDDVPSLLRIGYCYEGLQEFDLAIEYAEKARKALFRLDLSNADLIENITEDEINHALGHFYSSRYVVSKSPEDRQLAIRYMANISPQNRPFFHMCLGVVYTETELYSQAVELFSKVILDPKFQEDPFSHSQAYFYRGQAYSFDKNNIENAIRDLEIFKSFCKEVHDSDGLATANLYLIRARLKQSDSIKDLINKTPKEELLFLSDLLHSQPLPKHAIPSLKEVYNRYDCFLNGIIAIKEKMGIRQVNEIWIKGLHPEEKLDLLIISDEQTDSWCKYLPQAINLIFLPQFSYDQKTLFEKCNHYDVWIAHFKKSIPEKYFSLLLNYQSNKFIFMLDETTAEYSSGEINGGKDMEDCAEKAIFLLLYKRVSEYLEKPIPVFGLYPEGGISGIASERQNLPYNIEMMLPLEHKLESWQIL